VFCRIQSKVKIKVLFFVPLKYKIGLPTLDRKISSSKICQIQKLIAIQNAMPRSDPAATPLVQGNIQKKSQSRPKSQARKV